MVQGCDKEEIHKVVYREVDPMYEDMRDETEDTFKSLRESLKQNKGYKEVVDAIGTFEDEGRERKAKKRKIVKTLRQYTNAQQGEARFKGWSPRAASNMLTVKDSLVAVENELVLFSRGYRTVYRERVETMKSKGDDKRKEVPEETLRNLWSLAIERVEI
jgi:hypothetical protein